jgi:hypothetical protein
MLGTPVQSVALSKEDLQALRSLVEVSNEAARTLGIQRLRALLTGAVEQAGWYERLVETLEEAPGGRISEPAILLQARRLAEARRQLLAEHGALRSHEVAELAGSEAANASSRASDWRRRGRIFAVEHQGQTLFPAFQFGPDGRPRPVIAQVLEVLAEHLDPWQIALWFTSSQECLGGSRPVDRLDDDPSAVLSAARAETEPVDY